MVDWLICIHIWKFESLRWDTFSEKDPDSRISLIPDIITACDLRRENDIILPISKLPLHYLLIISYFQVTEFESVEEHITRNASLHANMFAEHYKANEKKHEQEKTEMINQIQGLQLELKTTKDKFQQTTRQMQQEFENKIHEFQQVLASKLSEVEAVKARGVSTIFFFVLFCA